MNLLTRTITSAVFAIGLFVTSSIGFAAGYTTNALVGQITHGAAYTYVYGPRGNPDSCSRNGIYIFRNSAAAFKSQYASLLAAKASSTKVKFYVNGCEGPGSTTYPSIYSVIME